MSTAPWTVVEERLWTRRTVCPGWGGMRTSPLLLRIATGMVSLSSSYLWTLSKPTMRAMMLFFEHLLFDPPHLWETPSSEVDAAAALEAHWHFLKGWSPRMRLERWSAVRQGPIGFDLFKRQLGWLSRFHSAVLHDGDRRLPFRRRDGDRRPPSWGSVTIPIPRVVHRRAPTGAGGYGGHHSRSQGFLSFGSATSG